jgi:hypothetical protein
MATFNREQIVNYANAFAESCYRLGVVHHLEKQDLRVVLEPLQWSSITPAQVVIDYFTEPEQVCGIIVAIRETDQQFAKTN